MENSIFTFATLLLLIIITTAVNFGTKPFTKTIVIMIVTGFLFTLSHLFGAIYTSGCFSSYECYNIWFWFDFIVLPPLLLIIFILFIIEAFLLYIDLKNSNKKDNEKLQ